MATIEIQVPDALKSKVKAKAKKVKAKSVSAFIREVLREAVKH